MRTSFAVFLFCLYVCFNHSCASETTDLDVSEHMIGDPDAPILVVEYASYTCSHCAFFAKEIFPEFKSRYIDSGKACFVFRDLPTDPKSMFASLAASCASKGKNDHQYFDIYKRLFDSANKWVWSKKFKQEIMNIVNLDDSDVCVSSKEMEYLLLYSKITATRDLGIYGVPTIFVNDRKFEGYHGRDVFFESLDQEMQKFEIDSKG